MAIGPAERAEMPKKKTPAGWAPEAFILRDTAIILNCSEPFLKKEIEEEEV
jgi:hypothetical protein